MKLYCNIMIALLSVLMLGTMAWGQTSGDYRSAASGNWNATATWQKYDGSSWIAATATPTSADGIITIRNGHVVTISATGLSYDQVIVDAGGQVTVASSITSTLANGTGTDLIINGTWLNSGGTWTVTGASWTVGAGGTYIHNTTSGISTPLGVATLDSLSNFIYRGSSTLNPAVSLANRTYGNLTFESTSGQVVQSMSSGSTPFVVKGNFDIGGTGAGTVLLGMIRTSSATTIYGNLTIRSGCADTVSTGAVTIYGNITNNGAFMTNATGTVAFNGNTVLTGNAVTFANGFTVNAGKSLALGTTVNVAAGKTATINGTFQLNDGGWGGSTGTYAYGANGTLAFNSSTLYTVNSDHVQWPSTSGPPNVTVGNGGIVMNVSRTVTGTYLTSAKDSISSGNVLTINGTLQLNNGGYFTNSPTYGSSSTLKYNTGGTYGRYNEWNSTSGPGYPANVQISNSTTLNYPNGSLAAKAISGSLTIDAGSALYMDYGAPGIASSFTIGGNLSISGAMSLGDQPGSDVNLGGNFTLGSGGSFFPNSRAVTFNGSSTQSITASGGVTFDYLTVNKSGAVNLNDDITMNKTLAITSGTMNTDSKKVTFSATGSLSEAGNGNIVIGTVEATRTLAATGNETFGGIGLELNPTTTPYPGATTVTRVTGTAKTGGGNYSIKRYYDVAAATSTGLALDLVFHYDDATSEIGTQNENTFTLYRSATGSEPWTNVVPTSQNTGANTISVSGVTDLSTWTASDASNALITSASTASDVVSAGGESATISSLVNNASPLSSSTGAQAWQFTVRDGGGSSDADSYPTQVTAITITQGTGNTVTDWSNAILAADLFDGSTRLASGTIAGTSIAFSGLTGVEAADGGSKTLSLRLSLRNPLGTGVQDNQLFVFQIASTDITAGGGVSSSQFSSFTSPVSDNTKDVITVDASKLLFATQPSATAINGIALVQQPVVTAYDANNNKDLDYAGTVTLTNSGAIPMSGHSVAAVNGDVVFTALTFVGSGSGVTLSTTNENSLTDATSSSIDISEAEPTTQASAVNFTGIGATSATVQWTDGNGSSRIVLIKSGSAVNSDPVDGTGYNADPAFGLGQELGTGNYVVYSGSGNSVSVTGLTTGTTYYFSVYEYNGSGTMVNYLTPGATGSVTPGLIQSAQTGNWSSPSTWVGGIVPTSADDVLIATGTTVTVDDASAVCKNVTFGSGTTSKLSFASGSVLGVYGDFTLKSTTQNAIDTWASGAKLKFTGSAATQTLSGWNTGSTMSTSFLEMQVDKSSGKVTTSGVNMKLNIGTSLEILNGTFEMVSTDDINGRLLDGTASTPSITVQDGGMFRVIAGATQIQSGTTGGTPIGTLTIYGTVSMATTSSNKINFSTVDVQDGGILNISTGWTTGYFNPGTVTVYNGGTIIDSTTTNVWFAGTTLNLNTGGVFKTTASTTVFPTNFVNNGTVRYARPSSFSGDQTIVDMDYHRLEISFTNAGTKKIWTLAANRVIADSVEINNSGILQFAASAAQTVTVNGTVRLTTGTIDNSNSNVSLVLADGATISRATGAITNAPVFGSTVNLRYTSVSGSVTTGPELPTSATVLNNLSVSTTGQAVTLAADATVNGTISLSSGKVITGPYTLYVAASGTVSRTDGYVAGKLNKPFSSGVLSQLFEIGDTSKYTPVTLSFNSVTVPGDITASTTEGDHSGIGTSGIDPAKSVNRYYSLTNQGVGFDNAQAEFTFDPADVDAGANPDNFIVRKYNGANWAPATVGTKTATSTQVTGLTSFSDFAIGEPTTHTITAAATGNGSISPSGAVAVSDGASKEFTIIPDPNYHIDSVVINGVNQGVLTNYTFTNVTGDSTIAAYFSIDRFTITVTQADHGTIAPGTTTLEYGASQAFTFTPVTGYHVDSINIDGVWTTDSLAQYTFASVTAAHTLSASYSINTYPVNISIVGSGSVTKDPDLTLYPYGTSLVLHPVAEPGWYFESWSGDTVTTADSLVITVFGEKNYTVTFTNTPFYSITASAGAGGSITPSGSVMVEEGNDTMFTFTPSLGYHVDSVFVNDVYVPGATTDYTFTNVMANQSIHVTFAINTYTLTVTQSEHGTIAPGTSVVNYGTNKTFTITPETGFHVDSVFADGIYVHDSTTSYTFKNVTANHTLTATFAINTYTITPSAGLHGTITPAVPVAVAYNENQRFTFTPDEGYYVDSVIVDGGLVDSLVGYTFKNVMAAHTIRVTFKITTFTITVTQGGNGTIAPGTTSVAYGATQVFTITPNTGYHIDTVFVDGVAVDSMTQYTFINVTGNHTLTAKYAINTYTLTVNIIGNGSVQKSPDLSVYTWGDVVYLDATADRGWIFTGWSGDASGTTDPLMIVMTGNPVITATFVEDAAYFVKYRSFNPDSIALSKDNFGKTGKSVKNKATGVDFVFFVVAPSTGVDGLHLECGTAIDTVFDFYTVPPSTKAEVAKSKLAKWNLTFASPLNAGDTVWVYGHGKKGNFQKVGTYWWMTGGSISGSKLKNPIFAKNVKTNPMPNRINVLERAMLNGYAAGMTVGVAQTNKDSAKKYGWVFMKKSGDVLKSLSVTSRGVVNVHDQVARGFDSLVAGTKKKSFVNKQTSLPPTKHDNRLFADLTALKVSIAASALTVTPLGFGELVLNDTDVTNPWNGLTLTQLAAKADTLMTGYAGHTFETAGTYAKLETTIRSILDAFEGPMDTTSFGTGLVTKGTNQLVGCGILQANPGVVPYRITPATVQAQTPDQFALYQNYPNPFNPATAIQFDLPAASIVTLKVFNILGQEVTTLLADQVLDEGRQIVEFDATSLASGVYFYRITAQTVEEDGSGVSTFTNVKKMMLVK